MTCSFIDSTIISYKIGASIFRVYSHYSKKKAAVTKTSTVSVVEVGYRLFCSNIGCAEFSIAVIRELDKVNLIYLIHNFFYNSSNLLCQVFI